MIILLHLMMTIAAFTSNLISLLYIRLKLELVYANMCILDFINVNSEYGRD